MIKGLQDLQIGMKFEFLIKCHIKGYHHCEYLAETHEKDFFTFNEGYFWN